MCLRDACCSGSGPQSGRQWRRAGARTETQNRADTDMRRCTDGMGGSRTGMTLRCHDTQKVGREPRGERVVGEGGGGGGGGDQASALPGQGEQWGWAGLGWAGLGWGATSRVTLARPASVQPLLESPSGCSLADAPAGGSDGDFSAAPGRRRTRATGHSTAIGRIADLRGWNGGGKGGIPARATRSLALVRARAGRDETGCMQSRPPLPQHYGMRRRHGHSGVERSTEVKLCRQSWWAGWGRRRLKEIRRWRRR